MKYLMRLAAVTVLGTALATAAHAQIPGMPLFTNPRYGTGLRVHADFGQATEASVADRVIQGGVTFALGPVGIGANVGLLKDDFSETQTCVSTPSLGCEDNSVTGSLLAQLRVYGGGPSNMSLSVFGGVSSDFSAADVVDCASTADPTLCQAQIAQYGAGARQLTIPVGASLGLRIPLLLSGLTVWGAPRYNLTKFISCDASNTAPCDAGTDSQFRWAVGADLPILGILSVRAAFESGKVGDQTVSYWGLGASIGLGGMR